MKIVYIYIRPQSCIREMEKKLLFYSMHINDSNDLKKCDDEQRHRAHVAVKDLHPVVSGTHGEDETDQEG